MPKMVRISDELHQQVKQCADREQRSINMMAAVLIAHSLNEGYTTIGKLMTTYHSDGRVERGTVPDPSEEPTS